MVSKKSAVSDSEGDSFARSVSGSRGGASIESALACSQWDQKEYFRKQQKNRNPLKLHALSDHVIVVAEHHSVSIVIQYPHKALFLTIKLTAHTDVVAPTINHKGLKDVVVAPC